MIEIHPKEITGSWNQGYVLDVHTVSSTMIGYNEFGYPEFDTLRSPLGELVYRLKYKGDKSVVPAIVEAVAGFLKNWSICPDVVIPMPPSKQCIVTARTSCQRNSPAYANAWPSLSRSKLTKRGSRNWRIVIAPSQNPRCRSW
jgi:hypothetical protein